MVGCSPLYVLTVYFLISTETKNVRVVLSLLHHSKLPMSFARALFLLHHARLSIFIVVGIRHEGYDDSRSNMTMTSSSSPTGDTRSHEEELLLASRGPILSESRAISGASELLALLGILGEGYRLSCVYKCQVLHSDCRINIVILFYVAVF